MKILHVIPYFAPAWRYGGPVSAALGLARELVKQRHEVTVMTTNVDGPGVLDVPLGRPVLMDGVQVWYFKVDRPKSWCFSRSLNAALQQQVGRFDVVHIHTVFLSPTALAAYWCRRRKVPHLIRPCGSLDPVNLTKQYDKWWVSLASRAKKWIYLNTLGHMYLRQASALHFASHAEMAAARPLRLKPPGVVVSLGVELEHVGEKPTSLGLRERYPQLQQKKIVLFLSRFDPMKGLDRLIPALGDLATRHDDFAFVLAGSGTPTYEEEVALLIKRHGLQDRTVFLGFVVGESKWSLLREADLFVLTSYRENFGISVVEAMAAGLPMVISDRVNIHEEVRRAGAGLVTSLHPQDIAAAVEQCLGDENLRQEMGRKGVALVGERFTWEKVVKEMVAVYTQIIAQARGDHTC